MRQRASRTGMGFRMFLLCGWLLLGLVAELPGQEERPVISGVRSVAPGSWRVDWDIPEGLTCQLQRSFDLRIWENIGGTITSESPQAWLVDAGVGDALQCYWRIDAEGGPTGPVAMFRITSLVRSDGAGNPSSTGTAWAVTWTSEANRQYRLERSHTLQPEDWTPVATVTASGATTTHLDTGAGNEVRTFWRVVRLGPDEEPLIISEVVVAATLNGATSSALFQIVTGGTETVDTVRFFDDGILLGDATPGFGDTWTFSLQWNESEPRVTAIDAEVTTEEGTTARSTVNRFLLADPSKFVPLDENGAPLYGQFVPVDEAGELGAFLFFPEGFGDPVVTTGAFFEFGPGARLADEQVTQANKRNKSAVEVSVEFAEATFHRGPLDPAPITVTTGGTLDLGNLTPQEVSAAFNLTESEIQLCWGSTCVFWKGGTLDEGGWASLQIELPIGDFTLPGTRLNATITFDPETGEPFLVVCYFGSWTPLAGTTFAIPEADPLKIYLTQDGRFSAHGSAEATFPNNAKVRGTIGWREPVFEFAFEGKGIVIPALGTLNELAPANPEAAAPSGDSDAELDSFAETLTAYQATMRGISTGSTSQATLTDAPTATASATPEQAAGATLAAWAGRLQSWNADRTGSLTDEQFADLAAAVQNGAKTANASDDLATILSFYKSLILVRLHHGNATAGVAGEAEFAQAARDAEELARVRFERLIDTTPEFSILESLVEAADFLEDISRLLEPAPAGGSKAKPGRDKASREDLQAAVEGLTVKVRGQLFVKDFTEDNASALLAALRRMLVLLSFERTKQGNATLTILDLPNLAPSYTIIKQRFPGAQNNELGTLDLRKMRLALAGRAEFLRLVHDLGDPLDSNFGNVIDFGSPATFYVPRTDQLIEQWLAESRKLPPAVVSSTCNRDLAMLAGFMEFTADAGTNVNARAAASEVAKCKEIDCDPVRDELVKKFRQTPEAFELGDEGLMSVRVTGMYETPENSLGARTLGTMQLAQAGRLVIGRMQLHRIGGETESSRILGLLKSDSPTRAEFVTLVKSENGEFFGGPGSLNNAVVMTVEKNGNEVTASPGGFGNFRKVSDVAPFSPLVAGRFSGESREVLDAWLKAPLHSTQIKDIRRNFSPILANILHYLEQTDDLERRIAVLEMSEVFASVGRKVTAEQMPLARQILREMLNQSSSLSEGERISHWNWLRVIFGRHQGIAPASLRAFMGPEINSEFDEDRQSFRYLVSIAEVEVGIDTPLGEIGYKPLAISIKKSRIGSPQAPVDINLVGAIAQGGAGLEATEFLNKIKTALSQRGKYRLPDADDLLEEVDPDVAEIGAGGDEDLEVFSEIDYTEASLTGSKLTDGIMMAFGINASGAAFGFEFAAGPSVLVLYGDGSLPPFVIPLPLTSADNSIKTNNIVTIPSLAANFGLGKVFSNSALTNGQLSLSTEIVRKSFDTEAGLTGSVHFEVGSPELRRCGWSNLRFLVAEMRAIFESPTSTISILGFTDATGSDSLNALLSQQRADAVKQAIATLVGEGFAVPPDKFRAIGLGREPSMDRTSPREGELTAAEAALLAQKKADLPTLSANQANGDWRSVSILLNNLITIDLKVP